MNQEYETLAPAETPAIIDKPYLMVTFIPCFLDDEGAVWLEQGWHHDLVEHLRYIIDFTLCAPKVRKAGQPNLLPVAVPEGVRFRFVELPDRSTAVKALVGLPKTLRVLWRAIGQAEVVHSSVIGWPYPLGWIVNPFAVMRRRALIIVVESSWRNDNPRPLSRLENAVKEAAARWSCRRATVALFTQPAYRDALYRGTPGRAYVTPAVWINEGDVLSETDARRLWDGKAKSPARMLFAGRLVAAKGLGVLLDALRILDQRGTRATVDIIGEGSLRENCVEAAEKLKTVKLTVLETVPYGAPFFKLVQGYHAVLIPSLSDEQPRVVFDANAQAVPVIASNTPGLRPHVENGTTGWLIDQGKPEVLAAAMEIAISDPDKLRSMGMHALLAVRGYTHVAMHRTRSHILRRHLFPD